MRDRGREGIWVVVPFVVQPGVDVTKPAAPRPPFVEPVIQSKGRFDAHGVVIVQRGVDLTVELQDAEQGCLPVAVESVAAAQVVGQPLVPSGTDP